MILIVVKNRVRPKYADAWPHTVEAFTTASRAEPGNVCFDWFRGVDDPNVYVLVEAYEDEDAGRAHVESDHFKAAGPQLSEMLAAVPEIVNVEVAGGWSRVAERPPVPADPSRSRHDVEQ